MTRRLPAAAAALMLSAVATFSPSYTLADEKNANAAGGGKGWSTIKGRVVFAGNAIPKQAAINPANCAANRPVLTEDWVVNPKNKGVRWTILWLDSGDKANPLLVNPALKQPKDKDVVMDQPCCAFEPHVVAMREGQVLVVKNSSRDPHNTNWSGVNPLKNPGGNVLIPPGKQIEIKDLKADKLPLMVACNIHPWMKARVAVLDHPYFAVTDADGKFEIPLAPAGKYRLKVYHESVGWRGGAAGRNGMPITIKDGGVTDLGDIDLKDKYE